jgi:hypothetical protein
MKIGFNFTFNKPLWKWWLYKFILFSVEFRTLQWKDKFATPRCEYPPKLEIIILNCEFTWYFGDDRYWEQWLWTHKYCNHNKKKAKETWPWRDMKGVNTWKD